ncbi:succinate dehydrogenase, partial [Acidimicrobiia bacterium]|nr:succinate dehydrogenase [Acidimicrobiia bacterium]
MKTQRTDWGRRQPPLVGSSFELYAWFFMRVSGLLLVLLAVGHMFIMHVFNDTLNLDYEFVAARWDTPYWRAFDWLLLALSLLHGTNGLRVVLHDNISDQTVRKISLTALYVTSTVFFIL